MTATARAVVTGRSRQKLVVWAAILNAELLLMVGYYALVPAIPSDALQLAYPWIWINASIWAVSRVDVSPTSRRARWLAVGVGVGYLLILGYFGGIYQFAGSGSGFRLAALPPGWGPLPIYSATVFTVVLLPFKVIGFATLAYLVAATVADAAATGLAGLVGLFSCVSCTWPLLATVLTGVFGSASAAASVVSGQPYGVSTVVFLASVALLVWRPGR